MQTFGRHVLCSESGRGNDSIQL